MSKADQLILGAFQMFAFDKAFRFPQFKEMLKSMQS